GMFGAAGMLLVKLARSAGKASDPVIRQDLARLHTLNEIARFTNLRQKALREVGQDIPGVGNIAKLSMSRILRLSRDLGLQILGPVGTLHAYDPADRPKLDQLTGKPMAAFVTEMALFTQGPSIYGGTDEIQHNIIGERVLGLPKEPSNDRTTAFKDLPKNG
ncbi:MAG TPA: acyl-CoA dehydrogenase family protein, partial [Acidimicrobiales bacterium]|nr:acyl-CoA dehydrogenase family protein [Acidimicrobiales bacterium]